jgi:endoglucanase
MQSDWQTGFCFSMQVVNQGTTNAGDWQLSFQMAQAEISNSWNGTFTRQGDRYTVMPPDWGRAIQPGQTVDMGFCANKQGSHYYPQNLTITDPP